MDDCIFCKLVKDEIPSKKEKETEDFVVIHDIKPMASTHLLIISKEHIGDIRDLSDEMWLKIKKIALDLQKGLSLDEFQLRLNWGKLLDVDHFHIHFISGLKE